MWQSSQCAERPSAFGGSRALLEDFAFSREEIPRVTKHVLERHTDEVWFVAYSHDGTKLATAAKDAVVAVWEVASMLSSTTSMAINPSNGAAVSNLAGTKMLCGHTDALCAIAWSPDDTHLLTCACDQLIKMWDVNSGECVQTFSRHTESVTAIAWLPDGNYFISAGVDKTVLLWGVASGAVLSSWTGSRVHNLAVNSHGTQLIAACERGIRVCPIETMSSETPTLTVTEELWIEESEPITSLCLTKDGRHALVNTASQEIHLWELPSRSLIHRYIGHKQGRFVIRAAFGGVDESFVVCGSEDSQVYIWHRHSATLLEVLPGHSGAVNAVCWSPRHCMFASASDDHTVRVWEPGSSSRSRGGVGAVGGAGGAEAGEEEGGGEETMLQ